jgi:hypothetical protein
MISVFDLAGATAQPVRGSPGGDPLARSEQAGLVIGDNIGHIVQHINRHLAL